MRKFNNNIYIYIRKSKGRKDEEKNGSNVNKNIYKPIQAYKIALFSGLVRQIIMTSKKCTIRENLTAASGLKTKIISITIPLFHPLCIYIYSYLYITIWDMPKVLLNRM